MSAESSARPSWFVGAAYNRTEDQTPRFLAEGIWENGYEDGKYGDVVRSMRPGDKIAIKSSYTRKHDLPFDNRGATVSVLAIKAVGTITANLDDGKHLRVDWSPVSPPREWYFYTNRATVWRVAPGGWMEDGLLAFAFDDQPQDINRFRNEPFWRERFGDADGEQRFRWTAFYSAVAAKLLDYRADRQPLIEGIHAIAQDMAGLGYLQDRYPEGGTGPLRDICPFTAMGTFNRSMTEDNRRAIAGALAKLIGVEEDPPASFEGIPVLNNQRSWFFSYGDKRGENDIDKLWDLFIAAAALVEADQPEQREAFISAYDAAVEVWGASWNLSTGLYWSHPWEFPTLDRNSRAFLTGRLQMRIPTIGPQKPCSGTTYLKLVDDLKARFGEDSYPVHSFPELSLASWRYKAPEDVQTEPCAAELTSTKDQDESAAADPVQAPSPTEPYDVDDIMRDGCFLEQEEIERLLERLRTRKNLILQGPPGTGKTWIAKRLAFALMGERDEARIRAVQFHPNLSYEDFVRGWRPSGDGKLTLADGVFMEAIRAALGRPDARYVIIIEEINRGNPAQIFGELLTLLEAGKRTPREALELCYPDADGLRRPVHVPENLFVIGTMNIADRSLALVDLAFRRRFAFVGLEPRLGPAWRRWVTERGGGRFSARRRHRAANPCAERGDRRGVRSSIRDWAQLRHTNGETGAGHHTRMVSPGGRDGDRPAARRILVRRAEIGARGPRSTAAGMVIADAGVSETAAAGFIGRIPVRNIWLLMLYASDLFRTAGRTLVDVEHNPDEIADLVAELLAQAVEERQRRQLSLGYRPRSADLSRVRGRIDVLRTERRQLLARGAVACRFVELSVDTPRNRFVRGALGAVARLVTRPELRHRCRRLAADMQALGVSGAMPSRAELSADRIGRHDATDCEMLAAAMLAIDLVLPTERAGPRPLPMPDREEQWARRLFERAVGGFYKTILPPKRWRVHKGGALDWPIDWWTEGAREILPGMQTDIVLDDALVGRRIVIDTKFTSIVTAGWRREATLRSGYLYQIYAYIRSQAGRGDPMADKAEGLLLHPAIGETIDEAISVHGHLIRFATVDLAADSGAIRRQLLKLSLQLKNETSADGPSHA